ncbi:bucentaur or craniofacial development-domain-containing protein [Phycomyces nitens]|nr:bucentaur or craniofacial development-domain-containing protein [Phycomyces nitens]
MQPPLKIRQEENARLKEESVLELDDESEDDSDYTPDQIDSDSEPDEVAESDEESYQDDIRTPDAPAYKRKRGADDPTVKRPKVANDQNTTMDNERKAKIDAIWAEMNLPDSLTCKEPVKPNKKDLFVTPIPDAPTLKSPSLTKKKKAGLVRPKSKLSDLVSQYNIKVPKTNTLEKSRLDWQGYVDREGIREDLKYQNKDGYMEKVAFLQRVDDRRFTQLKTGQRNSKK